MGRIIDRRRVMGGKSEVLPYGTKLIDMGLPSGILWADRNLGANSPDSAGLFFAWGETTGYSSASARNSALGLSGGFDTTSYQTTGASAISGNLGLSNDAAYSVFGNGYSMPTITQFNELLNNTTRKWVYQNSVLIGVEFTSSINGNKLFFPVKYINGTTSASNMVCLWTTTGNSQLSAFAYRKYSKSTEGVLASGNNRYFGYQIRAIYKPT